MVQFPSLSPASGLPGQPHRILGTALPKKECFGLSGPNRFFSLIIPSALRPSKGGGTFSGPYTLAISGPSARPLMEVPRTVLPPALPTFLMDRNGEVCAIGSSVGPSQFVRGHSKSAGGCFFSYVESSIVHAPKDHWGIDLRTSGE